MWNSYTSWCAVFLLMLGTLDLVHGSSTLFINDSGPELDTLTNLSGGNLDRVLAVIEIDSLVAQSPNGFRLEISSLNGGQLVRMLGPSNYADDAISGNVADYTFSLVSGTGTLGTDAPSLPTDHPLSTTITLDFDQNVVGDTTDKQYDCVFTVPAKTALFEGTFGDELTFTLTDL
jgi:hypothetical protein